MKVVRSGILFALTMGALHAAKAQESTIGHPAPPLVVARWIKGEAVPHFERGKVYVVEFWATWCAPCKRSIPHLTQLAHKYAGKAAFIGVDVYDQGGEVGDLSYVKKVRAFVERQKDAMDYRVAVDGVGGAMANAWLKAYGEGGIPTSFVVDPQGRIAWIGHPEEGLDEAVAAVLGPDYDLAKAAQDRTARKAEELARRPLSARFLDEIQRRDWKTARDLSDQLLSSEPQSEASYASARFLVLLHTEPSEAYAYARKLSEGVYKAIPGALNGLVRMIAEEPELPHRDLELAHALAQKVVSMSSGKEPRYLESLAIVEYKSGERAKAIGTLTRAAKLAETSGKNPSLTKMINDRLVRYQAGKG